MKKIVLQIVKRIWFLALFLVLFIVLYLCIAYIFSKIRIERAQKNTNEISIYILSNGVHTDFVLPIKNPYVDWNNKIKLPQHIETTAYHYVAFGWGDKGFYLETPTWEDLKFSTAFNALFGLSSSAIHATFYSHIRESKDCIRIDISKEEYLKLVHYIENTMLKDAHNQSILIDTHANYGTNDVFYEAKGSYSLFYTCNTWVNEGLKQSNLRACLWTPFDSGIFEQYKIEENEPKNEKN